MHDSVAKRKIWLNKITYKKQRFHSHHMSVIIYTFWFWCSLQRYVRSQIMYTDNNILSKMSALSQISVTAVLLPRAVLRCLEPHRRRSAFPKPLGPATLSLEYQYQHRDLKKQQKQTQHTILKSAVKTHSHQERRTSCLTFFSLSHSQTTKQYLYATTMSEAVKQEQSIQIKRSNIKEMGW